MLPRCTVASTKRTGLAAWAFGVGLAGCVHQFPLEPGHVAESESLVVALERVSSQPLAAPGRLRVELRADRWPREMTLQAVALAPAEAIPCTWGLWAKAVSINGQPAALPDDDSPEGDGVPVQGGDQIDAEFGQEAFDYLAQGQVRVDVLLAGPDERLGCASVPVADAPREVKDWERYDDRYTLELLLEAAGSVESVRGVASDLMFALRFGRWLGPVRPTVTAGAGLGFCSESRCPLAADGSERSSGYMIPLGLGVDFDLHTGPNHALRVGVDYQASFNKQNYYAGTERFLLHVLGVRPGVFFAPRKPPLGPGWMGIELPVRMLASEGEPLGLSVGGTMVLGITF